MPTAKDIYTFRLLPFPGLLLIALGTIAPGYSFATDVAMPELPVVLTPARMKQSIADTPASVTIITADMLESFAIRSLPDALRLVPGMAITNDTGNDYRVGYHGSNILSPRRMNVLIDGVSAYRTGVARLDWKDLPVAIADIERIEVTRSPDSAAWGPNSMMGVINIVTRHPADSGNGMLQAGFGSKGAVDATVRLAGNVGEQTVYRMTVNRIEDHGYDLASTSTSDGAHDGTRLTKLMFNSVSDIGASTLGLDFRMVDGINQIDYLDKYQVTFPDVYLRTYDLSATWRKAISPNQELQVLGYVTQRADRQPWRTCLPPPLLLPEAFDLWGANPAYLKSFLAGRVPTGGTATDNALLAKLVAAYKSLGADAKTPVCVNGDQDIRDRRINMEVQDTAALSSSLRVVGGLGWRQDSRYSQTYLGGEAANVAWNTFANAEYKPSTWLTFNAGGFYERTQLTDSSFAPRGSANLHLAEGQTLRAIISRATRTPNIIEQRADWTYPATDYSRPINGETSGRFYAHATSPGGLESERAISRELGYYGVFMHNTLQIDLKYFNDSIDHLISEKLQIFDFQPTNSNSAKLRGSEVQFVFGPRSGVNAFATYSYLDNQSTSILEQTQYSRHTGSLGFAHRLNDTWHYSVAYYGASSNGLDQSWYGREDVSLGYTARLGSKRALTLTLTVQHLDNNVTTYFVDYGKPKSSSYNGSTQGFLSANFEF